MTKKLILYYFTGTGNALAVSRWLSTVFGEHDIDSEIIKITPSLIVLKNDIPDNTLIGFCYPTHGFNAPPVVINFLLRFPSSHNKVFIVNTRAGMKLSKLFTPGLSGLAQLFPASVLLLKGFKIIGLQPMDLPSNWISIHPGLKTKVVGSIFNRCEEKTRNFAEKILSDKKVFKGLLSLPVDLAISPISVGYYFYGRFTLSKTFIADSNCNGCALCEKECPVKAIKMKNNRPFWTWKCESCMHCMNACPKKAIQTPHLFVAIIWWLVFSFLPVFFNEKFIGAGSFLEMHTSLFNLIIFYFFGLPIIFISYGILFRLCGIKFINWLVVHTSLTKFSFWRRYSAPKKHIK